ncbi:uncharacterized protein A4U43_C04F35680 [Asparagus officinalis]|uniref:Uncharacterized protein n=1 Tax=Asparagus officinalis TaxID=4686 RepID=A0A5P1F600_ASPOF|nr:uncharacterized protein A4U43_C04F35680 [Asparagus officinalis]
MRVITVNEGGCDPSEITEDIYRDRALVVYQRNDRSTPELDRISSIDMAPIVFAASIPDYKELMKRNEELKREVSEGKEREERMKEELATMRQRLRMVEEAEERLCSELGDLEAEAVIQARAYKLQIKYLCDQLKLSRGILGSTG